MTTIIKIDDKLQARVAATKENENVVITVVPAAQSVPPGCRPIEVACRTSHGNPLRTTAPSWVELVKWIEGFFLQPELVTIQHNAHAWTLDHVREHALEWDANGWRVMVKVPGDTWAAIYDTIRDRWPFPAIVEMTYDGAPMTTEELQSKVKQEHLRDPKPSAPPEGVDRPDTTVEIQVRLISDTGNVVERAFPSWTASIEWMDQHYRSPHTVHIMHDGGRLSFDRVLARAQKERPTPPRGLANRLRAWWSK